MKSTTYKTTSTTYKTTSTTYKTTSITYKTTGIMYKSISIHCMVELGFYYYVCGYIQYKVLTYHFFRRIIF